GGARLLEKAFVREYQRTGDPEDPDSYRYENGFFAVSDTNHNRLMTIGRDFMLDGKMRPGTILEDGNYFFGASREMVEDTFAQMTDEDRARLRRGLDMHLVLEGEVGDY